LKKVDIIIHGQLYNSEEIRLDTIGSLTPGEKIPEGEVAVLCGGFPVEKSSPEILSCSKGRKGRYCVTKIIFIGTNSILCFFF
jgi:hypothetical protein